jgi:D-serine deaminase-like pyridoxal phosphate-dependent protein
MTTTLENYVWPPISEIPTPVLLIDLEVFEKNLTRMRDVCSARGKLYRPHAKAHKSTTIAKMQFEYGAHGHRAAKLGEAEVLVRAGIQDVSCPIVNLMRTLLALRSPPHYHCKSRVASGGSSR